MYGRSACAILNTSIKINKCVGRAEYAYPKF